MLKNIFITGNPGAGKTTLIHTLLKELNVSAGGFYTQEIRVSGKRTGFKIITLGGQEGLLASIEIRSPYRVSRYGVNLRDLEEIGVKSIVNALKHHRLIIIDEVAKMELFSRQFQQTLLQVLDSDKPFLGTIMQRDNSFTRNIKRRPDTQVITLTRTNFNAVKAQIQLLLSKLL
jgi:nucleoside-triphosphatase